MMAEPIRTVLDEMNHGHVRENADGVVARCGGPGICGTCSAELLLHGMREINKLREEIRRLNANHSRVQGRASDRDTGVGGAGR